MAAFLEYCLIADITKIVGKHCYLDASCILKGFLLGKNSFSNFDLSKL